MGKSTWWPSSFVVAGNWDESLEMVIYGPGQDLKENCLAPNWEQQSAALDASPQQLKRAPGHRLTPTRREGRASSLITGHLYFLMLIFYI